MGSHERPGADRSARGPQKQCLDAGYYVTEILQKSLLPSLARVASTSSVLMKKIVPRDVAANLTARRYTGAHVQGSPKVVPRERGGLLGQEHITRELTGPQSNRKFLGNTESGARQSRFLLQRSAAHGASQSSRHGLTSSLVRCVTWWLACPSVW